MHDGSMLEAAARWSSTDTVACVLHAQIEHAVSLAAALGCGLAESIHCHGLISRYHRHLKCMTDRCWKSRLDGQARIQ